MAAVKDVPLTNEEIWDDSALVDSWNSALEEYKKYHSIHTKGGNVAELLKAHRSEPESRNATAPEACVQEDNTESKGLGLPNAAPENEDLKNKTHDSMPPSNAPALAPELVLSSVQDESLKKLLMSWYYAGYYTGLYEGQRSQNGQGQG
ncbi:uncharacterized protein B0I36DRAFT_344220 [Microdochium trichocladiopsis]|uniref:Survival Motor Neuron Gemin2-binding domain-containing protein n=1 Tax=Microdochium trichocladiopsis TaxID=1682393 RepID=A0A9P9BTY9_9PEZI|nr:uncharacterized protein B0I36DRAFT_344220 [Microdochium trichocladiopsis]KAH7040481.1 hypothetical protein B0I36DRAFT_344220 [Microdochium trichocladiopsis]